MEWYVEKLDTNENGDYPAMIGATVIEADFEKFKLAKDGLEFILRWESDGYGWCGFRLYRTT